MYKDTLRLPQTTMPIQAKLPANEPAVYQAWDAAKVYDRLKRDGEDPFILHDGPPYANGDIHLGHAVNKILKDFVVKYHFFAGRAVEFVPGWDCHGLPIEQKTKQEYPEHTTAYGIRCMSRHYVHKQITRQMEQFKALGVLADWGNRYETNDPAFEKMIYARLWDLVDRGLVYEQLKPVLWSWAERTALAEAEVEYQDVTDQSVYVVFPTAEDTFPGGLVVWTTTPWTLPANVAVAINPALPYSVVRFKQGYEWPLLVADAACDRLRAKGMDFLKIATLDPKSFDGWKLKHPIYNTPVPVVMAGFVTADAGTGCVHIAPGHGGDDYQVGRQYNLPTVMPVGPDGKYTEGKYQGQFVFDANKTIIADLAAAGRLLHQEPVTHSYPHCWRSGTPVIYRATNQFFLDLDKLREAALDALKGVEFTPANGRNRLEPMVAGRADWCLSRQRVCGVPIALIRNKGNGKLETHPWVRQYMQEVIGREGLDVWFLKDNDQRRPSYYNPWKSPPPPKPDEKSNQAMEALGLVVQGPLQLGFTDDKSEKVMDILDVWFDSGLTWNVLGGRQADLCLEGNDQHRGWFQSSLWLSVALTGKAPYKRLLTHGFVVDEAGRKMSKSKGNVVDPMKAVGQYGAEVVRYWVATTDYTKEIPASDGLMKQAADGHKKLRNTLRFLVANLGGEPTREDQLMPVDAWIWERSRQVFAEVQGLFGQFQYYAGMRALMDYVTGDLSGIYMSAAKDRLYNDTGYVRNSVVWTMARLLKSILGLIAPLFTYTAQEVFSHCPAWFRGAARDIFDLTYDPLPENIRHEPPDEAYWRAALTAFHLAFDQAKAAGHVKDTLEVGIEREKGVGNLFFAGAEDWFVVSHVTDMRTDRDALGTFSAGEVTYRVVKSHLPKCQRCWKRAGDLCQRCQKVISESVREEVHPVDVVHGGLNGGLLGDQGVQAH